MANELLVIEDDSRTRNAAIGAVVGLLLGGIIWRAVIVQGRGMEEMSGGDFVLGVVSQVGGAVLGYKIGKGCSE